MIGAMQASFLRIYFNWSRITAYYTFMLKSMAHY